MKNKIGLFIGRFNPFHNGHAEVIRRAYNYVNHLIIAIGSSQYSELHSNPFTYQERRKMINDYLKNTSNAYKIISLPDIGDPGRWPQYVMNVVGQFDILFSGNVEGVIKLFQPIQNGPDIIIFSGTPDISGTRVRENLYIGNVLGFMNCCPYSTIEVVQSSKSWQKFIRRIK